MSHQADDLTVLRRTIDTLDEELLKVLAQRMDCVKAIGAYKQAHALAPLDTERWEKVLQTRLETARKLGLDEQFVQQLLDVIHAQALSQESAS